MEPGRERFGNFAPPLAFCAHQEAPSQVLLAFRTSVCESPACQPCTPSPREAGTEGDDGGGGGDGGDGAADDGGDGGVGDHSGDGMVTVVMMVKTMVVM